MLLALTLLPPLLWQTSRGADMGYAFNGQCHPEPSGALSAFIASFPQVTPGGINTLTAAPTINASGVISYSLNSLSVNGSTSSTTASVLQLSSCTPVWTDYPPQFIAFLLAVFFAFAIGLSHGRQL